MVTMNSFDLLGDVDNEDPSQLLVLLQQKIASKKSVVDDPPPAAAPAKFPSKPIPPSQAVKESRKEATSGPRGGGRGGSGRGRGGRGNGFGRNSDGNGDVNGFSGSHGGAVEGSGNHSERERGSYRGSRQPYRGGGYVNGDAGGDFERNPHRQFDRHSRSDRGHDRVKRDGAGRGNWGTTDELLEQKPEDKADTEGKELIPEKQVELSDAPASDTIKESKEGEANDVEEKEDKEMTLEEYEKILEEKRKALVAMKAEERKVDFDKDFESMQQLSLKKGNDEIFIKLGSDKDSGKRKEDADRDERVKKSVSINEFLKPAEGERNYRPGGGRRGRGRGDRGQPRGFGGGGYNTSSSPAAPSIEDPGQFPTLGGK
ncbi:Hyaluronan/mRNA-binding protein [Macleaya cordata]|uniref:Hyaluronan/mRNA-binding protein n=1 Tax=Macleaya cordata TaxID=56857 RepID=A0A200QDA4_MACCD|nr:Hyaluronan/mRNA-binding protein [Macleaya cordata]